MNLRNKIEVLLLLCIAGLCYESGYNPYYIDFNSIKQNEKEWTMDLKYNEPSPTSKVHGPVVPEIKEASVLFEALDERVLRFKLIDAKNQRWEVPIYNPQARNDLKAAPMNDMGLAYTSDPFGFEITDKKTGQRFLSTIDYHNTTIFFSDKLIEFGLWFPAKRIFGLGERVTPDFELCDKATECIYTTFTKDELSPLDEGKFPGGNNAYGHHPYYMLQLKSGLFTGVFFLNSNAQDTIIVKSAQGINVFHKTIGGIVDLYFFYPGTAESVMRYYHSFIGRPYLPPMWTLGFHQCRWGWENLAIVKDVVMRYGQADIPLDVVWGDIDYMDNFTDFTINPVNYTGLPAFVDDLHKNSMYWVPIIDAGLRYNLSDPYYIKGAQDNSLVMSAKTKKIFVGKVWPGPAVYPAWMNINATSLWHMGLKNLFDKVKYDGIWLDMNEASNFCDGECPNSENGMTTDADGDPDPHDPTEFDNLPYTPGNKTLLYKALDPSAYHFTTDPYGDKFHKEHNLHSLWGFHQTGVTFKFLTEVNKKRPFVLTRASFAGVGRFSSKWLGDNFSTWKYLRYSIAGMYNYQMFGVPLVGADICGFAGDTNEELCARWMQLGAFYPFSRNHNEKDSRGQEPYLWASVAKAGRNAIRQKYSILRYYYTKLFEVSLHGGSLVKPLFFDYPNDEKAYDTRMETFMIGSAIMVAPALYEHISQVTPYFTNDNWFDLFSKNQIMTYDPKAKEGKFITLKADFELVNVLIKGGNIIPFQNALTSPIKRMKSLDTLFMELIIAPGKDGSATGNYIVDNQTAINPISSGEYAEVKFDFSMKTKILTVKTEKKYDDKYIFERFNRLTILGAESISGIRYACIKDQSSKITAVSGYYDYSKKSLSFYQNSNIYWRDIVTIQLAMQC